MLSKSKNRKLFFFLLTALILFMLIKLFILMERKFRPAIISIAQFRANILATEAVNTAIAENMRDIFYKDLVLLDKNSDGRILMAQVNTMEVNRLMAETTLKVQDSLKAIATESIHIPLGQALGSRLLAGYGPKIPVRITPVGRVNTKVVDIFEAAGINQTRHKIYFDISAEVQIVIPFDSEVVEVVTTVPVTDNVYVGEVPDTVINLQFP